MKRDLLVASPKNALPKDFVEKPDLDVGKKVIKIKISCLLTNGLRVKLTLTLSTLILNEQESRLLI